MRPAVRRDLLAAGRNVAARRVLAALELHWGSPQDAWMVLRDLPKDTGTFSAWSEFARRAEEAEAWTVVREALEALLRHRPTADLALRAARAALHADDPEAALALVRQAERGLDSAEAAVVTLPMPSRRSTHMPHTRVRSFSVGSARSSRGRGCVPVTSRVHEP